MGLLKKVSVLLSNEFVYSGILIALSLFLLVIQPLWALADCAKAPIGGNKRAAWIIAMIGLYFLVTIPYGIFSSRSMRLKITSLLSIFTIALWGWLFYSRINELAQLTPQVVASTQRLYQRADTSGVTAKDRAGISAGLDTLNEQAQSGWLALMRIDLNDTTKPALYQDIFNQTALLNRYLRDNTLSEEEAQTWLRFHRLSATDRRPLANYMQQARTAHDQLPSAEPFLPSEQ